MTRYKRHFLLAALLISLIGISGCVDLNEVDLSCRIPLTEYYDMVGSWNDLVSYSDSKRVDNMVNAIFTMISLRDYANMRSQPVSFVAGGSLYHLTYRVGEAPLLQDAYGNPVALTDFSVDRNGNLGSFIACTLANVGTEVSYNEEYSLTFTMPQTGKTCAVWIYSWVSIGINKAQGSYTDINGNKVYYDYPYAQVKWGTKVKTGVCYYLKGQHFIPVEGGHLGLYVLITDRNLDGYLTEQDLLTIEARAKGGTKGGLHSSTYPMNQYVPLTDDWGYIMNLISEPGPQGMSYFLNIQRQ
ncbi:MAG: hypothetical protein ACOX8I_08845 [Bacillota bacterium]|jgi:hypothetical protein